MATSIEQVSNLKTSGQLLERAERVIPGGGVYFTRSPRFGVPGMFPAFIRSASGCRIADVDGNEYIDFMCAFGPIVLGYNHPAVEEPPTARLRWPTVRLSCLRSWSSWRRSSCSAGPSPLMKWVPEGSLTG